MKKKIHLVFLVCVFLLCGCGVSDSQKIKDEIVVLYTGNINCGIDSGISYAGVSACKKELETKYDYVTLVDTGNYLSGKLFGAVTGGSYVSDIMEKAGYDIAGLGKKDFYYGVDKLSSLRSLFDFSTLSCNFLDNETGDNVFDDYEIREYGDKSIAFIGITEPTACNIKTECQYSDENGQLLYNFCEDETGEMLYSKVQKTVDCAKAEGADYVVVLSNLSQNSENSNFTVKKVIENTSGIDVVLNSAGNDFIECEKIKNCNDKEVILSDPGSDFEQIGKITFSDDGITSEMISDYKKRDANTGEFIADIMYKYKDIQKKVVINTPFSLIFKSGDLYTIRCQETNLGDLCADAYREVMDADIGLLDAGEIGNGIYDKDITFEDIEQIFPYEEPVCLIKANGEQIVKALEVGAMDMPYANRNFVQVSGLKYTIDTTKPSAVIKGEEGNIFISDNYERIKDVMVQNSDTGEYEPIDFEKIYTVALSSYMCKNDSKQFDMFNDCEIILDEELSDAELFLQYLQPLWGTKLSEKYENPSGEGRITIIK